MKKFLDILFRMLNLGGSQKAIHFWPKKGTIQWQNGYSSTRIEKKGTPLGFRAKKGHTAVNVCRAEFKMRRISFFYPKP